MNLSKYVTLAEAVKSQTATRLGIKNTPTADKIEAMKHVAVNVFDKIREHLGHPLGVSSFYRSPELNKAIGGSTTSQHCKGEAIDIDCDLYGQGSNLDVFNYIKDNLEFDQLIGEGPDKAGNFAWVHVSLKRNGKNRGEVLIAEFKKSGTVFHKYSDWKQRK